INCKMPKKEAVERATQAIHAVQLQDYIDQNPLKLSMGQKQRVVVAGALAMKPKLIVLDEPTTGQDPWSLQGIMDLMLQEYKTKTDIIMVTHDMNLVDRVANRVLVMSNNRLIADGNTDDIFSNSKILAQGNLEPPLRVQYMNIIENKLRET
ncbi:MAG: energy-coupling factor ABC transporter ATP-binding protein, partial [Candidatus Hodarchaeales archaeon]